MGLGKQLKEGLSALGKDYDIKPNLREGSKHFARKMGYKIPRAKKNKRKFVGKYLDLR